MARLPDIRRFVREDFGDVPWIEKLIGPLNRFMESVGLALKGSLTLRENLACALVEFDVDDAPTASAPTHFACGIAAPLGVQVLSVAQRSGDASAITGPVFLDWRALGDGRVAVSQVFGLPAGVPYRVRLLVWAG